MVAQPGFDRRALLRGGLAATVLGAAGLGAVGAAQGAPPTAPSRPARAGRAAVAEPRIYSTAEWGARPPSGNITVLDHVPTYIVVHHTVEPGNNTDYSLAHAKQIARDIQDFHMDGNGWSDTGQQFTISRGGYCLEGRHKSLGVVRGGTQHVQGANVGGHNGEVIGIENEGLYTSVDVTPALWRSLVALVAWIAHQYGRPVENIMGHRDFNSTQCPGDVLYGRLQELRDAVAGALGVTAAATPLSWPLLRPGDSGPQVRAAQHLLRAAGATAVRTDGVFDEGTRAAVARLADAHGIERHTCAAILHGQLDETGYLGSDIWPLITPKGRGDGDGEVAEAVSTLRRAGGTLPRSRAALGAQDWKRLLAV